MIRVLKNRDLKLALMIVFSIFFSVMMISTAHAAWWNDSFEHRKVINISHVGTDTLTDFPIFINVSDEPGMQADYDDIRITNSSCSAPIAGTSLLDIEKEYNDSAHAVFWARVPTIAAGITELCMYYGNSTVGDRERRAAVWKSNYGIVYHMDAAGNDSTSNNRDLVGNVGTPVANNTNLGFGMYFDGVNDAWNLQDIAYWEAQWNNRTHEVIFETSGDVTTRQTVIAEGGSVNGYLLYIDGGRMYARWWSESQGWNGDNLSYPISANTVYHVSTKYSTTDDATYNYTLHVNGEPVNQSTTNDFINAHSGNGGLGYSGGSTKDYEENIASSGVYYEGNIHELKVYDYNESDDWVNMSAYNTLVNHSRTVAYGVEESNRFGIVVDAPPAISTYTIRGNDTFNYNITVSCLKSESCGNITLHTQHNDSATTVANISTTSALPVWSNGTNNPMYCALNGLATCSLSWNLNASGVAGTVMKVLTHGITNFSSGVERTNLSANLTVEIVASNAVVFNQTTISIPNFDQGSGDRTINASIISIVGNNTDINVSCESGDCNNITDNWIDTTDLLEGNSQNITFTCDDGVKGNYSALFSVKSVEDTANNNINVSCNVNPVFGPINITLNEPSVSEITNISHYKLFDLNATVQCGSTCGNISAYAIMGDLYGNGSDGSLTVTAANTIINNYTYLTGNEAAASTVLNVNDASEFAVGNEILIIQMQNGSGTGVAGTYEFANISSTGVGTITIDAGLTNAYASGAGNQDNASITQIVRVPHYTDVTVNGGASIVSNAWDGNSGGIVVFRANGTVTTTGIINVSHQGFRGGTCNGCGDSAWGDSGESHLGTGDSVLVNNGPGGGGGFGPTGVNGEPGAGGGHATAGGNGVSTNTAIGGTTVGYSDLRRIHFGAGAGGGGDNDNGAPFPEFSDGAGAVMIFAKDIPNARIYATGEDGKGPGGAGGTAGGGAGGTIWLSTDNLTIVTVNADGGLGFVDSDDTSGDGGDGRIRLDYINLTGNSPSPANGYRATVQEQFKLIPTSISSTPFYINATGTNPLNCTISDSGSCIFNWQINASTLDFNKTYDFSVIALSNYSSISRVKTMDARIRVINFLPQIYLISPANASTFRLDNPVQLRYFVNDTDDSLNCLIYVNGTNVANQSCTNGNNTYNLTSLVGVHNWSINADDGHFVNTSENYTFTIIQAYKNNVTKAITSIGPNQYLVEMVLINDDNITTPTILIDHLYENQNAGSFTPNFDINRTTYGPDYRGIMYAWNLSLTPMSITYYNYSITGVGSDYEIGRNFVVGLD